MTIPSGARTDANTVIAGSFTGSGQNSQPTLLMFAQAAWFWRGRKLQGFGAPALSQIQGFVSGFVRKFVSGLDETPPE